MSRRVSVLDATLRALGAGMGEWNEMDVALTLASDPRDEHAAIREAAGAPAPMSAPAAAPAPQPGRKPAAAIMSTSSRPSRLTRPGLSLPILTLPMLTLPMLIVPEPPLDSSPAGFG